MSKVYAARSRSTAALGWIQMDGRPCSKVACTADAVSTLTYVYADSMAVLGPLSRFAEPHSYDLCAKHSDRLSVPQGWQVIRHVSLGMSEEQQRRSL